MLGFDLALIFLLYNEDFIANLVVVCNACLILLFIVGDGLAVALHFHKLPVHFYLLPKNHVHAKCELL